MMIGNLDKPEQLVQRGFRRLLTRAPYDKETEELLEFHRNAARRFSGDTAAAQDLLSAAGLSPGEGEKLAEQAAWVTVASVLLNLDETIMLP